MALGTKLKWVVAFAALGLAATPAIAQQQTKCTDDRQCFTGACVDGVCKATDAKLDVITPAKLSTQEQVAYGELLMQRIEGVAASIGKQLRVTREGRDVVKSLCLNDKLNQVDVAKRTAKDRQAALKAAAQAALDDPAAPARGRSSMLPRYALSRRSSTWRCCGSKRGSSIDST